MFVCLFFCNFLETTISNSILELFFFKEIKNSKRFRKIIKRTAKRKNASKSTQKRFSTVTENVFQSKIQLCSNNIRAALFVHHFNFVQSVAVDFSFQNQICCTFHSEKSSLQHLKDIFFSTHFHHQRISKTGLFVYSKNQPFQKLRIR